MKKYEDILQMTLVQQYSFMAYKLGLSFPIKQTHGTVNLGKFQGVIRAYKVNLWVCL